MSATAPRPAGREAALAGGYFAFYLGYLFIHPEGELWHWLSLVLIPVLALAVIGRYPSPRSVLQSIGLGAVRWSRGLKWVVVFGGAFQLVQLLNARQRGELLAILQEPRGFLLPLGALVLLFGTVATTEEVFFRGILQRRLADWLRNEPAALLLSTVAFFLYHVPYAYLNPSWPSAGNLVHALQSAVANGVVAGLALGLTYWRGQHNLLAAILLHALMDLVPATRLLHRLIA